MNRLQLIKKSMLAYVNSMKYIWSAIAYPLSIVGKKFTNLADYHIFGNSEQNGEPTPDNPIEVESVGEKTRNIWYPSVDALTSNGITCTRNNDNTYTVNGTATADFYFHIGKITIEVGTTYYLSGGTSQAPIAFQLREGSTGVTTLKNYGGITTFSPTGEHSIDTINCAIVVNSGVTVNNVIVKPMISLENTDEYEPYGKYKIPITVRGKNLIPYPYYVKSGTSYGVNYTINSDGSMTLNGTATSGISGLSFIHSSAPLKLKKGTYTISGNNIQKDGVNLWLREANNSALYTRSYKGKSGKLTLTEDKNMYVYLSIDKGVVLENETIYPLLEYGDTATSYEPYVAPVTTNIYLNEPLRKLGEYADYIDFKNKKVVRKIVKKIYNGAENWGVSGDTVVEGYRTFILIDNTILPKGGSNVYPPVKCNKFKTYSGMGYIRNDDCWNVTNAAFNIRPTVREDRLTEATKEGWKAFLADNPVTAYYVRATELEETVNPPALPQFKGTTIYEAYTSVKPSGIEVKYL